MSQRYHFLVFLHDLALFPGFYLYPVNDLVCSFMRRAGELRSETCWTDLGHTASLPSPEDGPCL